MQREHIKEYRFRFEGVYGRNRTSKVFCETLWRLVPEFHMPMERVEEMARAQLSSMKARCGQWHITVDDVEVYPDGLEIRPMRFRAPILAGAVAWAE